MARPGSIQSHVPVLRPRTESQEDKRADSTHGGAHAKKAKGGKKAKGKGKSGKLGMDTEGGTEFGIGEVDGYEKEDRDERRRKKRAVWTIGEEDFLPNVSNNNSLDPMITVDPVFRPQVSSRLASARSYTQGSTTPDKLKK